MWLYITVVIILFTYFVNEYVKLLTFWKNKKVKHVFPIPIFGSFLRPVLQKETLGDFIQNLYNTYPDERYFGAYQFSRPVLFIKDLELIKTITVKEFDSFLNHYSLFDSDVDPLWGKNLFASKDERWRDLRQTLSPVFTSSKMKMMFNLMNESGKKLVQHINILNLNDTEFEAKDFFSKFTTNVIATTAFGIEINSFEDEEFLNMGKSLTDFTGIKKLKMFLAGVNPAILKLLNIKIVKDKEGNFFRRLIKETIETREKQKIVRPDMIHLLMEARKGRLIQDEDDVADAGFSAVQEFSSKKIQLNREQLTDEDITAQALVFFFGGYDTTSYLMVFLVYELCANPDIQEKLREEMLKVLEECNGNITYDKLFGLKYLDMVVSETLRKWPIAIFLERVATKDFTIEPEKCKEESVVLEKGTSVWIPVYALQRNPDYFPDPEKFDPERFSDENKSKIHPYTYLPFGSGPRNCIGSRFALMENKILFFYILTNFKIIRTKKTQIPSTISKRHLNLTFDKGFYFGLEPLINEN